MHEVHAVLTRHQPSYAAVDRFGVRREVPLERGRFKASPNNPTRPDGTVHAYCPPLQVASEVDRLLAHLGAYDGEDPILVAAWFHHRFTQIHPYQDGNGRVARALTACVLVRAELPPLVIDRDARTDYLDALESADAGNLRALVHLFARQERSVILRAPRVDADGEAARRTTDGAAPEAGSP